MTQLIIRMLFLVVCASIGLRIDTYRATNDPLQGIIAGLLVGLIVILLEMILSKRPVQSISAIVFGLITGWLLAILFTNIFELAFTETLAISLNFDNPDDLKAVVQLSLAVICCFICVMVIFKTRDSFRFIIPYVEFQKEEKGARPIMLACKKPHSKPRVR